MVAEPVRKIWRIVTYLSPVVNRSTAFRSSSFSLFTMLAIPSTLFLLKLIILARPSVSFFFSLQDSTLLLGFHLNAALKTAIFLFSVNPAWFFRMQRINFPAIRLKPLACKRLMLLGECVYELFLPHCLLEYICNG